MASPANLSTPAGIGENHEATPLLSVVAILALLMMHIGLSADSPESSFSQPTELAWTGWDGTWPPYAWGIWAVQYPSTYDGDGIIAAKVRDVRTDGRCVRAFYRDGGRTYLQAVSCYRWAPHLFYDQTGDSWAQVALQRYPWAGLDWDVLGGY